LPILEAESSVKLKKATEQRNPEKGYGKQQRENYPYRLSVIQSIVP